MEALIAAGPREMLEQMHQILGVLRLDAIDLDLEIRFGRKLEAKVEVNADLIGGVRVVVGDEVLDTSVKARLERMKSALLA